MVSVSLAVVGCCEVAEELVESPLIFVAPLGMAVESLLPFVLMEVLRVESLVVVEGLSVVDSGL